MKRYSFWLCLVLIFAHTAHATVQPNGLFSKNAVLQRGVKVPVWGTANASELVKVVFAGQTVTTKADTSGKWLLHLKPLKAGGPYQMQINDLLIDSIYVGEVWLAGGQSNMERELGPHWGQKLLTNWLKEKSAANYPLIRMLTVPYAAATQQATDIKAKWVVCDTNTVINFSAVAYFFAQTLYKQLNVPIGIIHSSRGGTPAEKWVSKAALQANPALTDIVTDYDNWVASYPKMLEQYKTNKATLFSKWMADTAAARLAKKPLPAPPSEPFNPAKSGNCGGLYNGMIAPLIPYAMKGVIWYQGEANRNKAEQYKTLFPALINDWRNKWNNASMPFLFVQIAPYKDGTAELREAQLLTWQRVPNTAMVVTTDVADCNDIHPINKRPVGERLALAARALAYKEKIVYSGPVYQSFKVKNNQAVVSFAHTAKGLVANDSTLKGFVIAGPDKRFFNAKAVINKNEVIVSHDSVPTPTIVRFGWEKCPAASLFNSAGLPATPFRSDY